MAKNERYKLTIYYDTAGCNIKEHIFESEEDAEEYMSELSVAESCGYARESFGCSIDEIRGIEYE